MLLNVSASHLLSLTRLLQGREDCVLVSSCGGRVGVQSLLLALHSPLLASLLGEGERGVSLPLPLTDIRLLVAFIQGEEVGEVTEEVSDLLDIIWREDDSGGSVKEEHFTNGLESNPILHTDCEGPEETSTADLAEFFIQPTYGSDSTKTENILMVEDNITNNIYLEEGKLTTPLKLSIDLSLEIAVCEESNSSETVVEEILECKNCDNTFENARLLKKHGKSHKNVFSTRIHCKKCVAVFVDYDTLKNHKRQHKKGKIASDFVQESFKLEDIRKPLSCQLCKFEGNIRNFKKHMKNIHKDSNMFKCDQCPRKSASEAKMNQHKLLHLAPTLLCTQCSKKFHNETHLMDHVSRCHTPDEMKPHRCNHCGKGFVQKYHLQEHMHTHTGAKPYMCTHCVNTYSNSSNLSNHIKEKHPENYQPGRLPHFRRLDSVRASKEKKNSLPERDTKGAK